MSRFPLFTPSIPMIGRAREFARICANLTKPTPQHLSIVGPRYFGKTVLLEAIAAKMRAEEKFACVLTWDLGHQTPQSDSDFLAGLRKKIAAGLKSSRSDLADYLTETEAGYAELLEVIDILGKDGRKILMLWDGFDRPLRSGQLTRNLWDNLLELCRQKGFVLVTATRRKLQELIRDEKSVTSEFWQVFEVVRLGLFDDADLKAFASAVDGVEIQASGISEVRNWSGMIPVLVVAVLNKAIIDTPAGKITNEHVNASAVKPDDQTTDVLDFIWSDLSAAAADLFHHLTRDANFSFANASKQERTQLIEMGLARQNDARLQPQCKLVVQHVSATGPSVGLLGRLFGTQEGYHANIREVLERRLAQIPRFDDRIFHLVEQGIGDVPLYPDDCLNNLTNIEDRALDLIWANELEVGRRLPQEVVTYWSLVHTNLIAAKQNRFVREMFDSDRWEPPADRFAQVSLLQLLTGSHQEFKEAKARSISKDTYVLLTAIHSFRNRNQHSGGQTVDLGVAIAAIMLCIELLGCLARSALAKR